MSKPTLHYFDVSGRGELHLTILMETILRWNPLPELTRNMLV